MVDIVNIINLHTVNIANWIKDPNNIYVGRRTKQLKQSKWRNPYKINCFNSRKKVVRLFEKHLQRKKRLRKSISELKNKVLGCWCAPKLCHAQILHSLAGNKPVYQSSSANKKSLCKSVMDSESQSESFLQKQLDRELTNVLQAMSDEMENGDSKISDISEVQPPISEVQPPILPVDAQTPLEMSTVKMNNMYETLLDSKSNSNSYSSCNSSFEKLGS